MYKLSQQTVTKNKTEIIPTMRLIINLILLALVAFFIYLLVQSIREPIAFKAEKDRRETAVVDKLMQIRQAQEIYKSCNIDGSFAGSWDTLKTVLRNGRIPFIAVIGDPDDPNFTGTIQYDTTYKAAIDSVRALGWNLDSLQYIPYGGGKSFNIKADTLSYQKTLVNVVEVGTIRKNFMGKYASPEYRKYDVAYEPNSTIKFGDLNKPNLSGNWER